MLSGTANATLADAHEALDVKVNLPPHDGSNWNVRRLQIWPLVVLPANHPIQAFLEHHYNDMIVKNYKFRDINNLLRVNNFIQIYKYKMPFRKTFEYIYVRRDLL